MHLPSKAQIKFWTGLTAVKYRREEGLFLAEGAKVVKEALGSDWEIEALLVWDDRRDRYEQLLGETCGRIECYSLPEKDWRRLSQDETPEGLIAVVRTKTIPAENVTAERLAERGPLLMLHRIGNPNNLGAILRSADWFGFETVLLSESSVEYTNPKTVRASMGSLFHLNIAADLDFSKLLPALREHLYLIGSHVREGNSPHACRRPAALVLGSESHGLPEPLLALMNERWRIPGRGHAESLSLPQAAAIMMYECVKAGR